MTHDWLTAGQRSVCAHWLPSPYILIISRYLLSHPMWPSPRWTWTTWPWWWRPTVSGANPTNRGSSSRTRARRCPSCGCSSFTWKPVSSKGWCSCCKPPRVLDQNLQLHTSTILHLTLSLFRSHWKLGGWDITPLATQRVVKTAWTSNCALLHWYWDDTHHHLKFYLFFFDAKIHSDGFKVGHCNIF